MSEYIDYALNDLDILIKKLHKEKIEKDKEIERLNNIINEAIRFIEEGDLLYLASKCSIIYRNNIEVVAICDRLKDLLDILKGEDK